MVIYQDVDALYACLQQLFDRLQSEDPQASQKFSKARLMIRLHVADPAGVVVLNGRETPFAAQFGVTQGKADLEIRLTADTLHQILLGKLWLTKALGAGKLEVVGPMMKAMVLADLFLKSQKIYPAILQEQGLG